MDKRQVNPRAGLVHLLAHFGLIGLFFALSLHVSIFLIVPLGACLGALFPIMHEATHRNVFQNIGANQSLAFWTGAVLLVPATWFRHFHHAHHRFTQDPTRDPELSTPRPGTPGAYVWHLTGVPAWSSSLKLLSRQCRGISADVFVPPRKEAQILTEARMICLFHTGLILMGSFLAPLALLIFYGALGIGQIFLRAFLLAEHGGMPLVDRVMENTRTTKAAAWLRWLTWNMSFHVEHHENPSIPHDQLPAHHIQLGTQACASYTRFHLQFWRGLRRKSS